MVEGEIASGLKYLQVVKRSGLKGGIGRFDSADDQSTKWRRCSARTDHRLLRIAKWYVRNVVIHF